MKVVTHRASEVCLRALSLAQLHMLKWRNAGRTRGCGCNDICSDGMVDINVNIALALKSTEYDYRTWYFSLGATGLPVQKVLCWAGASLLTSKFELAIEC